MEADNIYAAKRPHEAVPAEYEHPAKRVAPGPASSHFVTDSVVIPHRHVDSVVGPNGAVLVKFETESGAKISCEANYSIPVAQTDRTLYIQGTVAQVTKAKQLITQFIGQGSAGTNESGIAGSFPAAVPGVGLFRPNIVAGLLANVGLAGRGGGPMGPHNGLQMPMFAVPTGNPVRPALVGNNGDMPLQGCINAPGTVGPLSGAPLPPLPPGHERFEVIVTKSSAGLVIGKGGETIKRLQAETGCRIQLIQEGPFANAQEKPLRVEGPYEAVQFAKVKILEIISTDVHSSLGIKPENRLEFPVPRESVGSIIGKGGESIKRIQSTTGVNIQFKPEVDAVTQMRTAILTGDSESLLAAKRMVDTIVGECSTADGKPQVSLNVSVPSKHTGLIIGRGGENIRQMQTESGAHIELMRDAVLPSGDKVFLVRGSADQCSVAQDLIRAKYESSGPQSSGGTHVAIDPGSSTADMSSSILANINTDQLVKYIQTGKFEAQPQADSAVSEEQHLAQLQAAGQMWAMQKAAMQSSATPQAATAASTNAADTQAAWAQYYQQCMGQYNAGGAGYGMPAAVATPAAGAAAPGAAAAAPAAGVGIAAYQNYGAPAAAAPQYLPASSQYQYAPISAVPTAQPVPGAPPTGPPAPTPAAAQAMPGPSASAAPGAGMNVPPPQGAPYASAPPSAGPCQQAPYGQMHQPQGPTGQHPPNPHGQYGSSGPLPYSAPYNGPGQPNPAPYNGPGQPNPAPHQHQHQHYSPCHQHQPSPRRQPLLSQPPPQRFPPSHQGPPYPGQQGPHDRPGFSAAPQQAQWSSQYSGAPTNHPRQ